MRRDRGLGALASLVVAAALLVGTAAPGASARDARAQDDTDGERAARRFLETFVTEDGRVARLDQGDDTVGEGQSYALALAALLGDRATFDRVWRFTRDHLLRDDGLIVHQATEDGTVLDDDAATDADVVTAWALLRRGGRHAADGRALAAAVLRHETLTVPDTGLLLAAGPWATGRPATLNPSYWAIPMLDQLAADTDDDRWTALAERSVDVVASLTDDGRLLPPDWARVDGAAITATPAPSGDVAEVRYSLDAQRVVVWLAASSDAAARELAARWWPLLRDRTRRAAIALAPDGTVIDERKHPLALVATAAAARAAGDEQAATRLLARARRLDARTPTYYGAAWVALGHALLTSDLDAEQTT